LHLEPAQWAALAGGLAVAMIGPTGHRYALDLLRPRPWIAVPAGVGLAFVVLLIGGRLPNVFIYFQF
jgi:alginate O-acetyltransferase complex protein AlgI